MTESIDEDGLETFKLPSPPPKKMVPEEKVQELEKKNAELEEKLRRYEAMTSELEIRNKSLSAQNHELLQLKDNLMWRMSYLESEKSKEIDNLMEELKQKQKEIEENLKKQKKKEKKFEAPVHNLMNSVAEFAEEGSKGKVYTEEEIKVLLSNVVAAVTSNDLYAPRY